MNMNDSQQITMQDSLIYIEFGERRENAIVEQPLSLLERQEFHNIATRHHGSVIESTSRRLVIVQCANRSIKPASNQSLRKARFQYLKTFIKELLVNF